ncbi:MAG: extensin family protein [Deltaproteobacteria bacterium]|nr:extensin family protein [Deltaproteobacteria bacterium]
MRASGVVGLALLATTTAAAAEEPSVAARPARARAAPTRRPRPARSLAVFEPDHASAPSYRYANMGAETCLAELAARQIAHTRVPEAPGVLMPVRIPESVGGVRYHTALAHAARAASPYEVFDCRLVLALHDLSKILVRHGVDDVVTFSAWRPPGKRWPEGRLAHRHPGALAVDVKALRGNAPATSGSSDAPPAGGEGRFALDVEADYHGAIGQPSCGPNAQAPTPPSDNATRLRAIVCEAVSERLFTSVLTPNHDHAHRNHLHLELTPGVPWRLVR